MLLMPVAWMARKIVHFSSDVNHKALHQESTIILTLSPDEGPQVEMLRIFLSISGS